MTPRLPLSPLLIATALCALVLGSQPSVGQKKPSSSDDEMWRIGERIRTTKKFRKHDLGRVLQVVDGPDGFDSIEAMLTLRIATTAGLFPLKKACALIEKKTCRGAPDYARVFSDMYPCFAQGSESRAEYMKERDRLEKLPGFEDANHHAGIISSEEREFCGSVFASKYENIRVLPGTLFASKRHLKPESRQWMFQQLDSQLAHCSQKVKPFWQFIKRVATFRSPGPKK